LEVKLISGSLPFELIKHYSNSYQHLLKQINALAMHLWHVAAENLSTDLSTYQQT